MGSCLSFFRLLPNRMLQTGSHNMYLFINMSSGAWKIQGQVLTGSMSAEDLFPSTTSHFWRKERALSCPWEPLGRRHLHDLTMQQRPHLKICSYKESNLNVCILRVHKSMAVGVQKSVKEKPCKDCKVCL